MSETQMKYFDYDRIIAKCEFGEELKSRGVYALVYADTKQPYYIGKHGYDCLRKYGRIELPSHMVRYIATPPFWMREKGKLPPVDNIYNYE